MTGGDVNPGAELVPGIQGVARREAEQRPDGPVQLHGAVGVHVAVGGGQGRFRIVGTPFGVVGSGSTVAGSTVNSG
jgi:hypothetical protein